MHAVLAEIMCLHYTVAGLHCHRYQLYHIIHMLGLYCGSMVMMFTCALYFRLCVEEREWRRQSQAVQRALPRPTDINTAILRGAPHKDQKNRAFYEVNNNYEKCVLFCIIPMDIFGKI